MAEYNPSKIIKDGNTYNFRDTTKIPLAGSNEISGSLIPSATDTYNFGSPSYQWNNAYIKSLTINGVACGDILTHSASEFVGVSGNQTIEGNKSFTGLITFNPYRVQIKHSSQEIGVVPPSNQWNCIAFVDKNNSNTFTIEQAFLSNGNAMLHFSMMPNIAGGSLLRIFESTYRASANEIVTKSRTLIPDENNSRDLGTSTNKWNKVYANKYYLGDTPFGDIVTHNTSEFVPRSGGAVMTGDLLASSTINSIGFGYGWGNGGTIYTYSPTHSTAEWQGTIRLEPLKTTSNFKTMTLAPDGTWTWSGTACQITSDQRYKQQIAEIDDKLLDAWEDVNLVQFKYNDAVDQKKDKARLHTGYVVQQIDSACKSHGVDVSAYGLYCHEEYPQETEEVEVEQTDGTKTKEIKVIREANEHYSLRYTEALIVECKYLRRCIARLTARVEELEKGNNSK